jgi:hypothetical protein
MSQKIITSWTCPACKVINGVEIIKPTHFSFSSYNLNCRKNNGRGCDSEFFIKFSLIAGTKRIKMEIISYKLSPTGEQIFYNKTPEAEV